MQYLELTFFLCEMTYKKTKFKYKIIPELLDEQFVIEQPMLQKYHASVV